MPPFLLTSLMLFIVWFVLFFVSKESRKEQLIMSVVGLVMTPAILLISGTNYRAIIPEQPLTFGIEDLLFGFSLFGVASILYHVLFGKHIHKFKGDRLRLKNPVTHWVAHLVLVIGSWISLALGSSIVFSIAPMQALIFSGLLNGMYIIASRNDLFIDALLSGLLTSLLIFTLEELFFVRLFPDVAFTYWQWPLLSDYTFGSIPLEEILWAGIVGFTIGPMYEWLRHYRIRD